MKILHVNTSDSGGAAIACIRLHKALLALNMDSNLLVKSKSVNTPKCTQFVPVHKQPDPPTLLTKIQNKAHRIAVELWLSKPRKHVNQWKIEQARRDSFIASRPDGLEIFSYPDSLQDITESQEYKDADIINLHWVASFLDWKSFFSKNTKPIVWTLHDQNPFLGGEHYEEWYSEMDSNGLPTQRIGSNSEVEEEKGLKDKKNTFLAGSSNIHIVSPSEWLRSESQKSALFSRFKHYHIPNGFPTDIFSPYDKVFSRQVLGLPQNKTIILFVAHSIDIQRKGYKYLENALNGLNTDNPNEYALCAIGGGADLKDNDKLIQLGFIGEERLMALAYAAADVFVIPSLMDNLPNTMIEALLCGTPTIGFPVGGVPEAIKHGENGFICEEISSNGLRDSLEKFLENPKFFDRRSIANKAHEKYRMEVQAKSYSDLYKSIIDQNSTAL